MLNFCKALVFVLVLVHLVTLSKSPVPWFDETYFASLSLSIGQGNGFEAAVSPLLEAHNPQAKAYGPGYLLLNAAILKVFGLGPFQNRILGLLAGLAAIWVFSTFGRQSGWGKPLQWAGALCLVADPIFAQSMHAGRMDTLAALCMISATYFAFRLTQQFDLPLLVYAGLLSGFCLLVSPRPAFLLVAFWAAFIIYQVSTKKFEWIGWGTLIALLAGSLYLFWIYWGFGSFQGWVDYFFAPSADPVSEKKSNLFAMYVGKNGYVPGYQYLIMAPALLGVFISFKHWKKSLLIGILASLGAFYLLITDTGLYSALIILFWYYLLYQSLYLLQTHSQSASYHWLFSRIAYALPIICLGLYTIKLMFIFITLNERNHEKLQQFVETHIPPGSRVIGDDAFYYAILESGSDFQYLIRGSHGYRRRDYHFNQYQFQYLIVSEKAGGNTSRTKEFYGEWANWKKIGSFRAADNPAWIDYLIGIYKKRFRALAYSFNADIYVPVMPGDTQNENAPT